jgi:hypothetical protein
VEYSSNYNKLEKINHMLKWQNQGTKSS